MKFIRTTQGRLILVSLGLLFFTGAGCSSRSMNSSPVSSTSPIVQTDQNSTEPTLTTDVSKWKQEVSINGLTFSYPSELRYEGGGDTDGGSYSTIMGADSQKWYFRIFNIALMKCKFKDLSRCSINMTVSATPKETFQNNVNGLSRSGMYSLVGEVKVGNVVGKKFVLKEKNEDGSSQVSIVFYGSKGAYIVEDVEKTSADGELFKSFLGTFHVK